MSIEEIEQQGREIWGKEIMSLPHITIAMGVVYGDICREARALHEGRQVDEQALQKELGNVIASTFRWCQDLGYDPEQCVKTALIAQQAYRANQKT